MRNINNKNTKKVLLIEIEKNGFFLKKSHFFLLPKKIREKIRIITNKNVLKKHFKTSFCIKYTKISIKVFQI